MSIKSRVWGVGRGVWGFALVALLAASLVAAAFEAPAKFDVIIANGRVVDGSGNPWYFADVGVRGGRIAAIGNLAGAAATKRIDAKGLVVAPGFIDMLGQSETTLLIDPRNMSKISQGITTEITGEGSSIAPQNAYTIAEQKDFSDKYKLPISWRTLDQYFKLLEKKGTAVNLGTMVGATQVREVVMGGADRDPTPAELAHMRALVDSAMLDGALGLGTSLGYAPAAYAKTEELVALATEAGKYGGIYITHMRSETSSIDAAMDELFRIAREAKLPVNIWHLKVSGQTSWGRMGHVLARIDSARRDGIDVTANMYPYIAGAASLSSTIPPWAHSGGNDSLILRLKNPTTRARIRTELETPSDRWQHFVYNTAGTSGVLVAGVFADSLKKYDGKRVSDIAKLMGKDSIDTLLDFIIADHANTGAIYFSMSEQDIRTAMKSPLVSFGVDASGQGLDGPFATDRTHPRAFGTFARILGRYVRDDTVLTLESAIRKMTSLAAQQVKIYDRGLLRPGMWADITIFDPTTVIDRATFEDPFHYSEGIRWVLVNGVPVWADGKYTGAKPGRAIRGNGARCARAGCSAS
ncbi:MAG: D-aminoacylase [Gemmatimonadota bacterium]|nr:D-aminoacylase [Gemmatimonadota bacterium]